jgi:Flp pilus assembly CpaF family ATPase
MKKNKSTAVLALLNKGMTNKEIQNRIKVSSSYIWMLKKQLAGAKPKLEDNTVEQVLVERGKDYGDYASKAQFIQGVKYLMRSSPSWEAMDADMRESMEMIAHKMGRTLYGDPTHKDNFLDIAGYAKLVADRL